MITFASIVMRNFVFRSQYVRFNAVLHPSWSSRSWWWNLMATWILIPLLDRHTSIFRIRCSTTTMPSARITVSDCVGSCVNANKDARHCAKPKKKLNEYEMQNSLLPSILSLLERSVRAHYREEVRRILRNESFIVTHFSDSNSTLVECRVLPKSVAWIQEDAENNYDEVNKEQENTG